MYELMRYTLLVVIGLACLIALFIAIAITSSIVGRSGGLNPEQNHFATYTVWGIAALAACLWISSSFLVNAPKIIGNWLMENKDHIVSFG